MADEFLNSDQEYILNKMNAQANFARLGSVIDQLSIVAGGGGLPAGGLTGQYLVKTSPANFSSAWVTLPEYQPFDNRLTSLSNVTGFGFLTKVDGSNFSPREIGGGYGITVANGDGILGNPNISLSPVGTAGTYTRVTTDSRGRVIFGENIDIGSSDTVFSCAASAVVGDFVMHSTSLAQTVEVVTDNHSPNQVIGMIKAKPTAESASLTYLGVVGGFSGLSVGAKVFLSSTGRPSTDKPSVGYMQILGVAISSTEFLLIPNNIRVKLA